MKTEKAKTGLGLSALGNMRQADLVMALALMVVLGVLFFPVPPMMLDLLLSLSIALSVLVMVFAMSISSPLELSAFPSILLLLTLFRLAMNVATTRQILLLGFAGNLIEAFGDFVVGGNYIVGVVVFLILVIINFKVITKGSGRIAEVTARFTLDAMPGKQMSIDADLNQGLIDEKEAVLRRETLRKEADFYGAMDGASKFVQGDAVAGLIITAINICAGFAVGMTMRGMTAQESIARYTILTIGDGLVSQIPGLIISTAAGILVTRAASDDGLGTQLAKQMIMKPRQLMITGGILGGIALVPALPALPFIFLGSVIGGVGFVTRHRIPDGGTAAQAAGGGRAALKGKGPAGGAEEAGQEGARPALPPGSDYSSVMAVSPMDLEIGFGLIPLVDRQQGGRLIERISNVRMQIAEELGIVLPPVNVRDNVDLRNTEYLIKIRGLEVARDIVHPGSLMAIDPSGELKMEGFRPAKEPAFGFTAYWIPENKREQAESRGFTVVDCASVVTTHLASVVKRHAADILTRQDVSNMIDQVKQSNPAVVQELIPAKMNVGSIHRILQGLLRERVSIRDMVVILETLADHAAKTQETALLVELCRRSLGGHIVRTYLMPDGRLKAIGLHPRLEEIIRQHSRKESVAFGALVMDPAVAQQVLGSLKERIEEAKNSGMEPVLVCSPSIRPQVRQLIQHDFPDTAVISFAEIPDQVPVDMLTLVPVPEPKEEKLSA
ncbi:MAG: flagellar biosynthesis protein FlhA [Kiritimatiellae bacterium]|nr:flagellar biosynthesis protein FlhA [Kiritimatiellia bacterium]